MGYTCNNHPAFSQELWGYGEECLCNCCNATCHPLHSNSPHQTWWWIRGVSSSSSSVTGHWSRRDNPIPFILWHTMVEYIRVCPWMGGYDSMFTSSVIHIKSRNHFRGHIQVLLSPSFRIYWTGTPPVQDRNSTMFPSVSLVKPTLCIANLRYQYPVKNIASYKLHVHVYTYIYYYIYIYTYLYYITYLYIIHTYSQL